MEQSFDSIYSDAVHLLQQLCRADGILASTIEADNYKRVWARDSIVCGLAGLWIKDQKVTDGLKNSLRTLAAHQHPIGMIPSNVLASEGDVSYGSLVGRIDASTWFVLGACMYYTHTGDEVFWEEIEPKVEACRSYLKACEFNDRGWLYTPLSGNWADEYPIHGYTLYDNLLRLWGEQLWLELKELDLTSISRLAQKTAINFWPQSDSEPGLIYQKGAFEEALKMQSQHFGCFILPGKYDMRFDAAANALALLQFQLSDFQKDNLEQFVNHLEAELRQPLIPAFWPVMDEHSEDWYLLKGNYSFSFKNTPGNFHNGGIWPVWMGLFCYGLAQQGMEKTAKRICDAFTRVVNMNPNWDFQEYFNARTLEVHGKTKMGYTASGIIFMKLALDKGK